MFLLIVMFFLLPLAIQDTGKKPVPVPEDTIARWILCDTKLPLYLDKESKPIWLDSQQLKNRATHCEPPKPLPLVQRIQVNGNVLVAILVNQSGNVECVKVISGHPLLTSSAAEAAKDWKFKPLNANGKTLAFCGLLRFHFQTGEADHKPDPCLCVHW